MAVTGGGTEEVKTVLTIETTKSASSMKELRQQIKQLKDELVGLDEGSQAYSDTLVVLGEKMHQFKEINEQVARTNTDFGDTIGNVSNVMAGGVAAVQGLTAGLSLLGVEMGEDDKITQTLVKSMALLQSLSSMDKAIKSFKALATVMKSNIAAAGGLSKALKALAISNPFTAILAAVVAVGAAIVKVTSLINEQRDAMTKLNMEYANGAMQDAYDELAVKLNNQIELMKINGATDYEVFLQKKANAKQLRDDAEKNLFHYQRLSMEGNKQERKRAEEYVKIWTDAYNESQKAYTDLINSTPVEQARADKAEKEAEEKKKKERQQAYRDKQAKAKEAQQKLYKQQDDAYKHELSLQKQAYNQQVAEIESFYQRQLELAEGDTEKIAKAEQEKQNKLYQIDSANYLKLIELAEQYRNTISSRDNKDGSQTAALDALDETIQTLTNDLDKATYSYQGFIRETTAAGREAQITKDALNAESNLLEQEIELTKEHNERYLALIKDKYTLQADLQAEAIRYEREMLETSGIGIENELENLRAQHEAKLISEEEYQNQVLQLEKQRMEEQARLRELDVEDEKNKLERKKELNEIYKQAISGILSSISNLLSAAGEQEDISFEDQKRIKTAQALISTFEAATSAYSAMAGIPVVGPGLGAAAAAAAIAAGLLQVRKIQQTTKNSANAASAGTTSAVTTVQTPPQIVNLNEMSDNISLPDQRVYVVESDITDAQRRVNVVETNATI